MTNKPRILVVGSFVMDVIATTERVPHSAQTVYGKAFHMAPGGKGANQALQCARLGAAVTRVGCVGTGPSRLRKSTGCVVKSVHMTWSSFSWKSPWR